MRDARPLQHRRVVGVGLVEPHHARHPEAPQQRRVMLRRVGDLAGQAVAAVFCQRALEGDELGADPMQVAFIRVVETTVLFFVE